MIDFKIFKNLKLIIPVDPINQRTLLPSITEKKVCMTHLITMILGDWLNADDLGCFLFLETAINLSWLEAQQKCEDMGGYLAELRTRRYLYACDLNHLQYRKFLKGLSYEIYFKNVD